MSKSSSPRGVGWQQEIILVDPAGRVPKAGKIKDRIDPETRAELRLAEALAAGASNELPPISQLGFETALDAMALTTKLALASDINCFVDWCLSHKLTAFPADAESIVRYLDARSRKKGKASTLARRVASISTGQSRDALVSLLGRRKGLSSHGHILVSGPTMRCPSNGRAGGDRTGAWCFSPQSGDISCAMIEGGWAARWDRLWGRHEC